MKISKLFLVPIATLVCASPVLFSCGKKGMSIEDLEDALFHPIEKKDPDTSLADGIQEMVDSKDEVGIQKEIIYALFAKSVFRQIEDDKGEWPTIYSLYEDKHLGMGANIHKCSLEIDGSRYNISFLGYINFVFIEDWEGNISFKKGDFLQITFSTNNFPFEIDNQALYSPAGEGVCFGIMQSNRWPAMKFINEVGGYLPEMLDQPHNWHNWTK